MQIVYVLINVWTLNLSKCNIRKEMWLCHACIALNTQLYVQ